MDHSDYVTVEAGFFDEAENFLTRLRPGLRRLTCGKARASPAKYPSNDDRRRMI